MNDRLLALAARMRVEIDEIERVIGRVEEGWQRARRSDDDYYLDGVALNLHGFYSGLERIFLMVAETLDGTVPQGENWHQLLLQQMAKDVPGVRPAVISTEGQRNLDEYRGFRHVVRNVYTFHFDPDRLEKLVAGAPGVLGGIKPELLAFASFLEQRGR